MRVTASFFHPSTRFVWSGLDDEFESRMRGRAGHWGLWIGEDIVDCGFAIVDWGLGIGEGEVFLGWRFRQRFNALFQRAFA